MYHKKRLNRVENCKVS